MWQVRCLFIAYEKKECNYGNRENCRGGEENLFETNQMTSLPLQFRTKALKIKHFKGSQGGKQLIPEVSKGVKQLIPEVNKGVKAVNENDALRLQVLGMQFHQ